MGSGKSAVGALVARRTGADFVDLDVLVERETGKTIADIFASEGEAAFRTLEKRALERSLRPSTVVALGGGAVADDESWALLGSRAVTVYIEVPFETMWARIHAFAGRPLIAGRSRQEVEALFLRRRPRYEEATHRVNGDRPLEEVAAEVTRLWSA